MGTLKNRIVISLGGSMVAPNGGIDVEFLKQFNSFIRKQLAEDKTRQFFIVVGGGATARHYIDAGKAVIGHQLLDDDLDWLGIHTTRLNAHLVRTIFRDIAHPNIIKHYEIIRRVEEPIVIAAGWKPGWSTDFCATMLCEDYNVTTVLNLSNIRQVHSADPKKDPNAKPIKDMTWVEFKKLVGDKWDPGMNVPFDPIATKKAEALGLKVVVMLGTDLDNVDKFFAGKPFVGTTIQG